MALIAFVSTVILLSGCNKKDTVEETPAVEEESSKQEVSTPEEVVTEESVEPELEVGTAVTSELDTDAFESDEAKDHQFGDIGYVAQYRDIRSTTGLNSESTDDVWEYLTEDGVIDTENPDELWEYGVDTYTGRWAYPTVLESELTKDFYLYDWSDLFCSYIADEGENNYAILMCTGYDTFNSYTDENAGNEYTFTMFKTFSVNGEDIDVYSVSGGENSITYLYRLGGFSVIVEFIGDNEEVYDESLLVEVMNDIIL